MGINPMGNGKSLPDEALKKPVVLLVESGNRLGGQTR